MSHRTFAAIQMLHCPWSIFFSEWLHKKRLRTHAATEVSVPIKKLGKSKKIPFAISWQLFTPILFVFYSQKKDLIVYWKGVTGFIFLPFNI